MLKQSSWNVRDCGLQFVCFSLSRRPLLYLLLPSGLIRMALHSTPGSEWTLWITSTLTRTSRTSTGECTLVLYTPLHFCCLLNEKKGIWEISYSSLCGFRLLWHFWSTQSSWTCADGNGFHPGEENSNQVLQHNKKRSPKKKTNRRRIKTSFRAAPAALLKCGCSAERCSAGVTVGDKL